MIIKNVFRRLKHLYGARENDRSVHCENEYLEPLANSSHDKPPSYRAGRKVRSKNIILICLLTLFVVLLIFYLTLTLYHILYWFEKSEYKKIQNQMRRLKINSNGDLELETSEDYNFDDPTVGHSLKAAQVISKDTIYDLLNNYNSFPFDPSAKAFEKKIFVDDNFNSDKGVPVIPRLPLIDRKIFANMADELEDVDNVLLDTKHEMDALKTLLDKSVPGTARKYESEETIDEETLAKTLNSTSEQTIDDPFESEITKLINTVPLDSAAYRYSSQEKEFLNLVGNSKIIENNEQCKNIPLAMRFDCHPEDGASQLSCTDRNCCWNPVDGESSSQKHVPLNVPYCYYPENWTGYEYLNISQDDNSVSGFLTRKVNSFYKKDIPIIKMEASGVDDSILRVKIYDPLNARYEPPWPIRSNSVPFYKTFKDAKYEFKIDNSKPGFKVNRAADKTALFDSIGKGGFIFADQFLQINAMLPSHNIYGLGEHRSNLRLNTNWQSFTLFNKDQPPTEQANLYGSHPFYLIIEDSNNCHGVLFLNSNAMDIILQPAPAVTFRTIGGIFDLYFFMGPTPADVLKQYSRIVGKPFLPPYWSLGFHLCRFGYGSLEKTKEIWNRTRAVGIPFDTQWNDLDYMDKNNDFTYNTDKFKDLPKFIEEIHAVGMHYIPLIDAGISAAENNGSYLPYDEGLRQDIFIKDETSNKPFIGKVWNFVSTTWPDFTNPKAQYYYFKMMNYMHEDFAYDGAWIDMNEPSNFYNGHSDGCPRNDLDYPQYVPNVIGNLLATKTLCMNARHHLGFHYNLHNTYGTSQAIATNHALTTIRRKRPFIISRSTWVGHGLYAGHWTGDIYSSWHDLKMSIPEVLSFSFFQIPMVGADICGFDGNTTESLCNRWMQLGAFYPFSRNHNSDETIEQDPVAMGDLVVKSSRKALMIRYRFLPYLYTLFFRAHAFGETVARPLFFEFIDDPATYGIDSQFLWGSSLMIVPVLEENKIEVTAYLPRGLWYDFYTKDSIFSIGTNFTLKAPLDTIPLLIRAGFILPAQTPNVTTTASRRNNFELLIALDNHGTAEGELYWDDGDSLDSISEKKYKWLKFTIQNQTLSSMDVGKTVFNENMTLGKVSIMGVTKRVDHVFLNGNEVAFIYDSNRSYLNVKKLQIDLQKTFVISWQYKHEEKP